MKTNENTGALKIRSRLAWLLLGLGMGIVLAGWLAWIELTGVSFWTSPNKELADRLRQELLIIATVSGALAPLFLNLRLAWRVALCPLGVLVMVISYYVLGLLWLFTYGV